MNLLEIAIGAVSRLGDGRPDDFRFLSAHAPSLFRKRDAAQALAEIYPAQENEENCYSHRTR
jgi:hypothetical protein